MAQVAITGSRSNTTSSSVSLALMIWAMEFIELAVPAADNALLNILYNFEFEKIDNYFVGNPDVIGNLALRLNCSIL